MKLKKLINHIDKDTVIHIIHNGKELLYGNSQSISYVNRPVSVGNDTDEKIRVLDAKVKNISIGAPDYSLRLEVKF